MIKSYILGLIAVMAVDLLWLGVFAKSFYSKLMSPVVTIQFNWLFVFLFYIFYFIGVYYFAIRPGVDAVSLEKTLINCALFGFFCYMTYDLTNMATIKDWPLKLVIVDILWGVTLTTLTGLFVYKIYFWLN